MKRASDQPSTSTGKQARPAFYISQQVLDRFDFSASDSESDEETLDQDYRPHKDDEDVMSDEEDEGPDLDLDLPLPGGRGATTADAGDAARAIDLDTGWGDVFKRPQIDLEYTFQPGPSNLPDHINAESSPLDFLDLFLPEAFWQNLAEKTNLRAAQQHRDKPNYYYAKNFKDVTVPEMKAFIGMRIHMEYVCIKPSYRDYWNNEGTDFLGFTPGYRNVLTRDRFMSIWANLHIVDEEDDNVDKRDKIYKVRPMLNDLLTLFRLYYVANRHLSLDEGMIPCKNRLSIKQYIRDKPIKWGIKSFLLCDADNGYVVNAEVYTGQAEIIERTLGAVGNTVVRMLTSAHLEMRGHILVMDRFYNSVLLSQYLLDQQHTGVIGTVMTNRKHYPKALKVQRLPLRGDYRCKCRDSITCLVWQDRKPIHFVSNYQDPEVVGTAGRRNKDGTLTEIPMPQIVKDYNSYMGVCDKNDQLTRLNRSRRHYRWPRRLMVKFFMWACYNSYIDLLYLTETTGKQKFTQFIKTMSLALIGNYRTTSRLSIRHEPTEQRLQLRNHFPEIPEDTSRNHVCAVCAEKHNRFKAANPTVNYKDNPCKLTKSVTKCSFCRVYLSVKRGSTCWSDWHMKIQYWR